MMFALLVCALLLVMVVYFAALLTGEIALWFVSRISQMERNPLLSLTARR